MSIITLTTDIGQQDYLVAAVKGQLYSILERRKELAFEGDRFFDMNRLKRDITRSPNAGAIQAGSANANLVIPYSSIRRVLPIPQSEIQANPNIASQQNPGY